MRAAARFRNGKALLQTTFQPTVDALLAERLMSGALAGPSTASSITHLAQTAAVDTNFSSLRNLARYYSSGAGRSAGIRSTGGLLPAQVRQTSVQHDMGAH